jgi:outer membrane protein assembly factor BamB
MNSAPVVDTNERIIIATSKYYQCAVSMDTHEELWCKSGDFHTPAVHDGVVYTIDEGYLYALDIHTGDILWSFTEDPNLSYHPVISNGFVFVSSESNVYAVDIEDHTQKWHAMPGGHLTIAYNCLYIAGYDGTLYAYDDEPIGIVEDPTSGQSIAKLYPSFPNPARTPMSINIGYYISESAHAKVSISNIHGKEIYVVEDGRVAKGEHKHKILSGLLDPGIYIYRLIVNNAEADAKKLVIIE